MTQLKYKQYSRLITTAKFLCRSKKPEANAKVFDMEKY
jgi:hypothetical protein